jgi:alpha-acetolactate decarboxylase
MEIKTPVIISSQGALSQYLSTSLHTLFQVSTTAALIEGIYRGAVRVSRLLQHRDFGWETSPTSMGRSLLNTAASIQQEFRFEDLRGTLLGLPCRFRATVDFYFLPWNWKPPSD